MFYKLILLILATPHPTPIPPPKSTSDGNAICYLEKDTLKILVHSK